MSDTTAGNQPPSSNPPVGQWPYGQPPGYGPTPQGYGSTPPVYGQQPPMPAPGPWPQPGYGAPGWPGYPATPPKKSRRGLIIGLVAGGVVLLAVIGLVIGLLVGHSPAPVTTPAETTPSPSAPASTIEPATTESTPAPAASLTPGVWSQPLSLGVDYPEVIDLGLSNIIVVFSHISVGSEVVMGVDPASGTTIWSIPGDFGFTLGGDSSGLVLPSGDNLLVVDPLTGKTIAQADASMFHFVWAGDGMILTRSFNTLCVSIMTDPGDCLWSAPSIVLTPRYNDRYMNSAYVFGDGKWINTGDGVRELATGDPAPFGQDARQLDQGAVFYDGPTGRIFKVTDTNDVSLIRSYQPWNTATDKAQAPVVKAMEVNADSSSSVFTAYNPSKTDTSGSTVTAYAWKTSKKLWQTDIDTQYLHNDRLYKDLWISDSGYKLVARDALTGKALWNNSDLKAIIDLRGNQLFANSYSQFMVLDLSGGVTITRTINLPVTPYRVYITTTQVCCVGSDGTMYVQVL